MKKTAASTHCGLVHLAGSLKLSEGQRNIALIQYAIESVPMHFTAYDAADIEWLNRVLSSLRYPDPPVSFEEIATEQDVRTYLSSRGAPLPGLKLAYDAGGAPLWQECEPTSIIQRFWYIQHLLLPQLAQVTIEAIASLTTERAEEMKVTTVQALPKLAETLTALDVLNEDSSVDFAKRPDPHRDLFGDTCRDVLKRRIEAILQLIDAA